MYPIKRNMNDPPLAGFFVFKSLFFLVLLFFCLIRIRKIVLTVCQSRRFSPSQKEFYA